MKPAQKFRPKLRPAFRRLSLAAVLAAVTGLLYVTPAAAAEHAPTAPAPVIPPASTEESGTPWIIGAAGLTFAVGAAMVAIGNRRGPGARG